MQSVPFLSPQFDFDLVESLDEVPVLERIDFKQGKGEAFFFDKLLECRIGGHVPSVAR